MHLWQATSFCLLASAAVPAAAASGWGFAEATVAVQAKGAGVNGAFKEQYAIHYTINNCADANPFCSRPDSHHLLL